MEQEIRGRRLDILVGWQLEHLVNRVIPQQQVGFVYQLARRFLILVSDET